MSKNSKHIIHNGGACNNHCQNCKKADNTCMTLEEIAKELDIAQSAKCTSVFFADRELLVRKDLSKILRELVKRNLKFSLATNGRALSVSNTVQKLKRLGLIKVEITMHAGLSYTHYLSTRTPGFNQTLTGIKNCLRNSLATKVIIPVDEFSKGNLKAALLCLLKMPILPEIEFLSDSENLFSKEIKEAKQYLKMLEGKELPVIADRLQLLPTGKNITLDLSQCPFKASGKNKEFGLRFLLLKNKTKTDLFDIYKLDAEIQDFNVFTRKNVRSHIFIETENSTRKLKLMENCFSCKVLAKCHACFEVDDQPVAEPCNASLENIFELNGLSKKTALKPLIEKLNNLQNGKSINLVGSLPIFYIGKTQIQKELVDIDFGLIADLAEIHGLELVDYNLPAFNNSADFVITYKRPTKPIRDVSERICVFSVSSACVANCLMCTMPNLYAGQYIETPLILPFLEELKLCGFSAVDSFGGEITLRDDLVELIQSIKSLNMMAMLITTGFKIYEKYLTTLIDAGLDKITIALDAPDAELHDHIKNKPGLFLHAIEAIKTASNNKRIYAEVNSVIIEDNYKDLVRLHKFITNKLGIWCHRMFYYTHSPMSLIKPKFLKATQAKEFFENVYPELLKTSKKLDSSIDFCPPIDPDKFDDKEKFYEQISVGLYHDQSICKAPSVELSITPDKEMYPCVSPSIAHSKESLGVLSKTKVIDAIQGKAISVWLKEAGTWPECRNCISKRS